MTPRGAGLLSSLSSRALLLGAAAWLAGCAPSMVMIDGVAVPRATSSLTGQAFSVKHTGAHPRPGPPSGGLKADGGSIGGLVCGMQIDYDVSHVGDHVQLIGFIDGGVSTQLQIRDEGTDRIITGAIGKLSVELKLGASRIEGHVGLRVFYAERQGDHYAGHVRVPGVYLRDQVGNGAFPTVVDGADVLLGLPAAEQAALLPNVLTCWWPVSENVPGVLRVGFGGEPSALPVNSSSLYSNR